MEELSYKTDDDDDEEYGMFGMRRSRVKRLAITDDGEESDNDQIVNGNGEASCQVQKREDVATYNEENTANSLTFTQIETDQGSSDRPVDRHHGSVHSSDDAAEDEAMGTVKTRMFDLTNDIFDAESSDDDGSRIQDVGTHTGVGTDARDKRAVKQNCAADTNSDDRDEDLFDESQVNPDLIARLKKMKGASSSGQDRRKRMRKAKTRTNLAETMTDIYSQSQRLLRDSRVSLPYHEPEPKLDDFLTRASQKRQEYAGLRQARDIQKARIICDRLSLSSSTLSATLRKPGTTKLLPRTDCTESMASHDLQTPLHLELSLLQKSEGTVLIQDDELPDLQPPLSNTFENTISMPEARCGIKPQPPLSNTFENIISMPETRCGIKPQNMYTRPAVGLSQEPSQEQDAEVCVPSLKMDVKSCSSLADETDRGILMCNQAENRQKEEQRTHRISETPTNTADSHHLPQVSTTVCSSIVPDLSTSTSIWLGRLQVVDLPAVPSLSGPPDGIIHLDDGQSLPEIREPGLDKLMCRLVQHSKKITPMPVHLVTPSILDEDEHKLATDCVVEAGQTDPFPGSKLDMLKQQLGVGMRKRRAEARHRRQQLFALENEEGFGNEARCSSDDEDTEMTEGSDTDELEEEDYQLKLNINTNDSEEDNDYNPLLDTEALDDDDVSSDVRLHFDVSGDEDEEAQDDSQDEVEEIQQHGQKYGQNEDNLAHCEEDKPASDVASSPRKWSSEMTPMSILLLDTQQQESRLRRETSGSPDLCSTGALDDSGSSFGHPSGQLSDTCQSHKFDVDSILKLVQTQPSSRIPMLTRASDDGGGGDKVHKEFGSVLSMSAGQIFHCQASQSASIGNSQLDTDNMKQLLGLCSGTFGLSQDSLQSSASSQGRSTQSFVVRIHQDDEDADVIDPFHVLSDTEDDGIHSNNKEEKAVLSESDEDNNDLDESDRETEDDTSSSRSKFTGLKENSRKYIRREFLDEEAELSGSECESDENLDLSEEDDVLEQEEGDNDLLVSQERLRDEVGRLHMKRLQDDDDKEVMRFKEMYLQDGDLYSDGAGRKRNFRWKNLEHNSEQDILAQYSDDEQAADDVDDVRWRKDRFDREKFLEEEDVNPHTADSQVLKLGQFFVQKQESIHNAREDVTLPLVVQTKADKPLVQKKGSFLSRGKETLVRIAQVVKTTRTGNTGHKSSRNFVFQTVDGCPDSESQKTEKPTHVLPGKRKALMATTCLQQLSKKQKIATLIPSGDNRPQATAETTDHSSDNRPQLRQQTSIFELFDTV